LTVVGDGKGKVALVVVKAREVPQAVYLTKAMEQASPQHGFRVKLNGDTLSVFLVKANHGASKMFYIAACIFKVTGIIAGGAMRAFYEFARRHNVIG